MEQFVALGEIYTSTPFSALFFSRLDFIERKEKKASPMDSPDRPPVLDCYMLCKVGYSIPVCMGKDSDTSLWIQPPIFDCYMPCKS